MTLEQSILERRLHVIEITVCDAAGGSEFKGVFARSCKRLGIAHTRTKPRHAWTNGFVERL